MRTLITLLIMILVLNTRASAGETAVYLKSGFFSWDEKIAGSSFVKERGMLSGVGVARAERIPGGKVEGLIEVWGGNPDYDGHDVTNTSVITSDTIYLGTKEEVTGQVEFTAVRNFMIAPLAGFGHKFWIRTRSNEDWNTIYGKVGAAAEYTDGSRTIFASSGMRYPFYTRSHVSLSGAGYEDVVTSPKSKVSPFAEAGVRIASWSFSVTYEEMNFGQSDKVATRSTIPTQNGVAVVNSKAFQPESSSSLIGATIRYHF